MKFCMLTSFFGSHSFGGDSAYVDRLSRALASRGHEVHVIYCQDAFKLVQGSYSTREYHPPVGVTVHGLKSWVGGLSPIWTQQTGYPGPKWPMIRRIIDEVRPDVVHFHNLSLIGGPGLLKKNFGEAALFMTAHEHWLVCPMHVLWRTNQGLCQKRECHRCSVAGGRPPQFWRHTQLMNKALARLDKLILPSQSAADQHRSLGITRPIDVLPYFLPSDWQSDIDGKPLGNQQGHRPYFACVGRMELIKGFQDVIRQMHKFPEVDLRLAGHGNMLNELRDLAKDLPNVKFEGVLEGQALKQLMGDARAVIVPSLVPETFGYVVLEAFAQGRPVIGRRLGALPEIIDASGAGILFEDDDGLTKAMATYLRDERQADRDGLKGSRELRTKYGELAHIDRYMSWVLQSHANRSGIRLSDQQLEPEIVSIQEQEPIKTSKSSAA